MSDLSVILSSFKVFEHFQAKELVILSQYMSVKQFVDGEVLMKKGEPGTYLCVVLCGHLDILDENVVFATRSAGDLLGEMALIRSSPRMADVVAVDAGEVAVMQFDDIEKFKIKHSMLAMKLVGILTETTMRKLTETATALKEEKERSERLLLNILPQSIAAKLKQGQHAIADSYAEVTVLFADIVGFTPLSAQMSPKRLLILLNLIFSMYDCLAEEYGLEKIKTIGDAYMVVGGVPEHRNDHAEAIAHMSLDMQKEIVRLNEDSGRVLKIRIGIATGPVIAGVIGTKKFSYDLWGDTVNVASRMESSGAPGRIQVTADTYKHLKEKFFFEKRGEIEVKGKGKMLTYWLMRRK